MSIFINSKKPVQMSKTPTSWRKTGSHAAPSIENSPQMLRTAQCNTVFCHDWTAPLSLSPGLTRRWAPREQTDLASAPRTAASPGLASDHGEGTSRPGRATTVATRHPEGEDGPLGEPHAETLHFATTLGTHCTCMHRRVVEWCRTEVVLQLHYSKVQCVKFHLKVFLHLKIIATNLFLFVC